jgi:hypothetical protein
MKEVELQISDERAQLSVGTGYVHMLACLHESLSELKVARSWE